MDNPSPWALRIVTAAVGVSPGLAFVAGRSPGGSIVCCGLAPRAPQSVGLARGELAEPLRLSRSRTAATNAERSRPRLANGIERVPKTQPVSGPITVKKEAIGWVCDARDDANRTPSVGYKRARSISSVGSGQRILRVGHQWRVFQRRNIGLSWQPLGLHQCSPSGSLTSSAGSCVALFGVTRKCHLSWDPSRPATNRPALPLRQAEALFSMTTRTSACH
jgi:hypothetical protein